MVECCQLAICWTTMARSDRSGNKESWSKANGRLMRTVLLVDWQNGRPITHFCWKHRKRKQQQVNWSSSTLLSLMFRVCMDWFVASLLVLFRWGFPDASGWSQIIGRIATVRQSRTGTIKTCTRTSTSRRTTWWTVTTNRVEAGFVRNERKQVVKY